nr:TolC family protein [Cytophagales bacterium]
MNTSSNLKNIGKIKYFSCSFWTYQPISNIHKYLIPLLFTIYSSSNAQMLNEYLSTSIKNNPTLQASFIGYTAAMEKVDQVGLGDPELSIGVFTSPMALLMGNQRGEASIVQQFPWFGMLKTQKDEATLMAEVRYEAFRQQRNVLVYEVKETFYLLQKIQNTIGITASNLEILKSLEKLALVRYQGGNTSAVVSSLSTAIIRAERGSAANASQGMAMGGEATSGAGEMNQSQGNTSSMSTMGGAASSGKLTDVLRLQVQIKALESDLIQLELDRRPLLARFNQLLGRDTAAPVDLGADVETQLEEGWELTMLEDILRTNPMLLMLEKEGLAYQKQAEMAKLEGKPMFGLGLNYMMFSPRTEMGVPGNMNGGDYMPPGMGGNMIMPMAMLSVPIYRKKYKAKEAEAKLMQEANELQKLDLRRDLEVEFERLLVSMKDETRKITLLEEQIALTTQTMELAITGYATDATSFEEVLAIQRELLDFRLNLLNTRIDREMRFAELETLVGL